MKLNYLQDETRGGVLSLDNEEEGVILYSYMDGVQIWQSILRHRSRRLQPSLSSLLIDNVVFGTYARHLLDNIAAKLLHVLDLRMREEVLLDLPR